MKQRITYIIHKPGDFDPEKYLVVKGDSLSLKEVDAAKEWRITFSLEELPQEIRRVLKQCHELHIRWASEVPYTAVPPFSSRVSPGLHAFFTPLKNQKNATQLCPMLKKVFCDNLKCTSPEETFIKAPILSTRFSMSSTHQYFSPLPSLKDLVLYMQHKACPQTSSECKEAASSLLSASYLDLDYDTISHALTLHAFWAREPTKVKWSETITPRSGSDSVEVGVLQNERTPDAEDIGFSGFLTVLGRDTEPKPTQFQTPARHHTLPQSTPLTYTTSFISPTGLHPTLQISISQLPTPPEPQCRLHTHLTLPSTLFIDKYQFLDPLFLSSHHIASLRSIAGATDLEAPDWVIKQWGSVALFEIATPSPEETKPRSAEGFNVTIPLHARYLPPSTTGYSEINLPYPVLFWACPSEAGSKMNTNPFDRTELGYEGLFGGRTRFVFGEPVGGKEPMDGKLVVDMKIPVLDVGSARGVVEWGTMAVVWGAFLGLVGVLFWGGKGKKGGRMGKKME